MPNKMKYRIKITQHNEIIRKRIQIMSMWQTTLRKVFQDMKLKNFPPLVENPKFIFKNYSTKKIPNCKWKIISPGRKYEAI
jgi:hypothetical protein